MHLHTTTCAARARAHRHTTEQLAGRAVRKKILLHNHERRRISQTDH